MKLCRLISYRLVVTVDRAYLRKADMSNEVEEDVDVVRMSEVQLRSLYARSELDEDKK